MTDKEPYSCLSAAGLSLDAESAGSLSAVVGDDRYGSVESVREGKGEAQEEGSAGGMRPLAIGSPKSPLPLFKITEESLTLTLTP